MSKKSKKTATKKAAATDAARAEFTKRVLMSAVVDVAELGEAVARIHAHVAVLAKAYGIKMPEAA